MKRTTFPKLFKKCPKSGKIVGINFKQNIFTILFPLTGILALIWFCVRVIPKPSRIGYPCQRAIAPIVATFASYILGIAVSAFALKKARNLFKSYRIGLGIVCILIGIVTSVLFLVPPPGHDVLAQDTGSFTPSDLPNSPMGTARGINPGRVAWSYDLSAITWDGTSNYWFSSKYNNQAKIDTLMKNIVCSVAGKTTVAQAWDTLFRSFNGGYPYVKGEKIAVKINLNNGGNYDNQIDASPQSVYSLLDQLVNKLGANQSDIIICDPARENQCSAVADYCKIAFPNVNYDSNLGGFTGDVINYSASGPVEKTISKTIYNSKYLITMALLKRHCQPSATYGDGFDYGNAPVTMIFKSTWGIIGGNRGNNHWMLQDWNFAQNSYHLLVDMFGSKYVNGKTVLNIIDGLYSGDRWNSNPRKWAIAPFNNHYPSSMFASQDPVALESVGLDFLRAEMPITKNADRCLHEAAKADNPPSGTIYKPDGVRLPSLGVHEHWNNSKDKKYSRNLGTGKGIELVEIAPIVPDPCKEFQSNGNGLKGIAFGVSPAFASGTEYCKAIDGSTTTYYDATQVDSAYTGIDLGSAKRIGKIRFFPRSSWESRMNGGKFQGSTTSSSSGFTDLYTITSVPPLQWTEATITNDNSYRWIRYLGPTGSSCNIAEMEIYEAPQTSIRVIASNRSTLGMKGGSKPEIYVPSLWGNCTIIVSDVQGKKLTSINVYEEDSWYKVPAPYNSPGIRLLSVVNNQGNVIINKSIVIR